MAVERYNSQNGAERFCSTLPPGAKKYRVYDRQHLCVVSAPTYAYDTKADADTAAETLNTTVGWTY